MFITTILFLTNFSYSSEFFELNGKTYELNEIDIRKEIGCDSKFYEYIVVGIKDTKSNELVWSWPEFKEVREYWKKNKECGGSGFHTNKIKHLWNRSGFVDFIVVGQDCGVYCTPFVKQDLSWIYELNIFINSQPNLSNISGFMSKRRESLTVPIGLGCT